jgi:biotin carboxylase
MKIVLFLNQINYANYNYSALPNRNDYQWVACLGPAAMQKQLGVVAVMDRILPVKERSEDENRYINNSLYHDEIAEIVSKLISEAGTPERVVIVAADELNLNLAGKLREEFKLRGAGFEKLRWYRNKIIMKQRLQKNNIRVPHFQEFQLEDYHRDPDRYFTEIATKVGLPFIFKPARGAGSFITAVINAKDELDAILKNVKADQAMWEVEEFIEGEMFHCDGLVFQNKIVRAFPSKYLCPNLDFIEGSNIASLPLHHQDQDYQSIVNYADMILAALGYVDGAFHLEFFKSKKINEWIFVEVAARPPGGMLAKNYDNMFGINLFNGDYCIQTSQPYDFNTKLIDEYSFSGFAPTKAGKVLSLNQPDVSSRVEYNWHVQVGDQVINPKSVANQSVSFLFYNKDYKKLVEDFEKLRDFNFISVR